MRVTVTGLHMATGPALQTHAEAKAAELAHHFDKVNDVHVAFVQEPHHHHLHGAVLNVQANGISLRAEGQGIDWYAALDDATAKLVRQLDKYKGRMNKHRERRAQFKEQLKDMGPLAFEESTLDDAQLENAPTDMFAPHFNDHFAAQYSDLAPQINKKEVTKIAAMSLDEAVMQMDLLHKPAFLFINAQTGVFNMVYREGDNAVKWVAPK
jgi:putative sigma-54 modulation protein